MNEYMVSSSETKGAYHWSEIGGQLDKVLYGEAPPCLRFNPLPF